MTLEESAKIEALKWSCYGDKAEAASYSSYLKGAKDQQAIDDDKYIHALVQFWISVKDRLPEEIKYESDTIQGHKEWSISDRVFVMNNHGNAFVDCTKNGKWVSTLNHPIDCDGFSIEITHWMPIPELPKE